MAGHRHDRAGAVLHQHVVGDVHRDALAVDGIDDVAAERDAGLLAVGVAALLGRLAHGDVDVLVHRLLVLRARGEPEDVRVLGRHDEERRAEQRVRPRGEDGVVGAQVRAVERDLGAVGAADPVALHRLDVLGPRDRVEVVEQPVRVVGDAEEPLLELADLDRRAAALAAPVDDLLVGQHRRVLRAPVDRGLVAVGEPRARRAAGRSTASSGSSAARGCRTRASSRTRPPTRGTPSGTARSTSPSSRAGARPCGSRGSRPAGRTRRSPSGAGRACPCAGGSARPRRRSRSSSDAPCAARRWGTGASPGRTTSRRRPRLVGDRPGLLALPDLLPARLDRLRVVTTVTHRERRR